MQQLLPKVCRSPLQAAQLQSLTGRTKTQSLETNTWDLLLHQLLMFLPAGSGLLPSHAQRPHSDPLPKALCCVMQGWSSVLPLTHCTLCSVGPRVTQQSLSRAAAHCVCPQCAMSSSAAVLWAGEVCFVGRGMHQRSHCSFPLQLTTPRTLPQSWCTMASSTR